MRTKRQIFAAITIAALTFAVAGCTDGGANTAEPTDGSAAPNDPQAPVQDASSDGKTTSADSPLDAYINAGYDANKSVEELRTEAAKESAVREDIIAQCMKDEGFDYYPVDWESNPLNAVAEGAEWLPDDPDWVAEYGYGVMHSPFAVVAAANNEDAADRPTPNRDYVAALTEGEREAYTITLYGEEVNETYDETTGESTFEYDWEKAGCIGKAGHETTSKSQDLYTQYEDLFLSLDAMYADVAASDKAVELNKSWSSCIAEAGYDFPDPTAASLSVTQRLTDLEAANIAEATENGEEAVEGVPDDSGSAPLQDPEKSAEWDQMAKEEVALATADLACRDETNYAETMLKIQFEREEQFLQDNKTELEQFKAAAEQVSAG